MQLCNVLGNVAIMPAPGNTEGVSALAQSSSESYDTQHTSSMCTYKHMVPRQPNALLAIL